ncbi:MAG TPA: calcium-binding protein, partial [Candidatus Dormibacteraeota bacterium]|nr:calcium-binding protein [Candidatus Dormibacteraeota bacterium]
MLHSILVQGGDGGDTLDFSTFTTAVTVDLSVLNVLQPVSPGELQLELLSAPPGVSPDVENVVGAPGGGTLTGNSLDNAFTITGGVNTINGAAGTNTIIAAVNVNATLGAASLSIGSNVSPLSNIQIAKLTAGNGGITINAAGFTGGTVLTGGTGNDRLIGGSGPNLFIASPGNDILTGGAANDTFMFDADVVLGTDTITGGGGTDTLDFSATSANVTINLGTLDPAPAQTVVPGFLSLILKDKLANMIGGSGDDSLTGNDLDNVITGGLGNDVITGGGGTDTVRETRDANFILTNTSLEIYRAPLFSIADITDLPGLVARLQSDVVPQTQPVSQYLWSQFTAAA